MSQYQQDELAQLFAQNMSFSQPLPQNPSTPDKQFVNQSTTYQPTYYMSQHYTPPSYQYQPPAEDSTTRADSPLSSTPEQNLESTLRQHDIDPTTLSPSQVKLFTNADYSQRLRLLELWRISPPDSRNAEWPHTDMAQEEATARIRYEERMRSREQDSMVLAQEEAEPYITSGYANHRHSDPVYSSGLGLWQSPGSATIQRMEDSYGAFQQARNFEQLQHMNHQVEAARMGSGDDDMVM